MPRLTIYYRKMLYILARRNRKGKIPVTGFSRTLTDNEWNDIMEQLEEVKLEQGLSFINLNK